MTPWLAEALGVALMTRARARGAAYRLGCDTAIDGHPAAPECMPEHLRPEYTRGYQDGRAQLATYRPEENPYARR